MGIRWFFVFFFFLPLWGFAQLQDSHFYKVAEEDISSPFQLNSLWKVHVEGSLLKVREQTSQTLRFKMYGKMDLKLAPRLRVEFEPYLVLTEGPVQMEHLRRFNDQDTGFVQMYQGFLHFRPFEGFSLQAGAINQGFLNAPLLMDDDPALSLLAGYLHIRENYEWQLVAQQSMLSFENSFRRYGEIARLPFFTSLFAYGEWLPSDLYSFKGHATGFYFTPLPGVIANESRLYGNSIEGGEKSSSRFLHRYYGANFDVSSQWRISSRLYLSLGYSGIFNMAAPAGKNWAETIYTVMDMDYLKWLKLLGRMEYFYNESDTAPAYFNSSVYGHNNRKGLLFELKTFVPKGNLEWGLRYVWSQPITKNLINSSSLKNSSFLFFISSRYQKI